MFFTKIELHNFGVYRGTQSISLADPYSTNGKGNIVLIGGLNGRGKTTLLNGIFLAFYGKKALPHIYDGRKSYNNLIKSHINKSASDNTTHVSVTFVLQNGERYQVTRKWYCKDDRTPVEKLFVYRNDNLDPYLAENWDYYIEDILPLNIAPFFFFDNEKIKEIADDDTFEKIKESILAVMGLTVIDHVLSDIQRIIKEKETAINTVDNSELMARLKETERTILAIETNLAKIHFERAGVVTRLEKIQGKLEETERQFWKQSGHLGLKKEEIEDRKAKLKNEEAMLKQRILNLAANPGTPLVLCKGLLEQVYNRVKAQEGAKAFRYSQPIVTSILKGLIKKIDELPVREDLRTQVTKIIEEELNKYQEEYRIKQETTTSPLSIMLIENLLEKGLFELKGMAMDLKKQIEATDNALLQLDTHLSIDAEQGGALELFNLLRDLERTAATLRNEIEKIDQTIKSLNRQKDHIQTQQLEILKELANLDNTVDDNVRILHYALKSVEVMNEFKLRLQKQKVHQLEENISRCFKLLAHKETMVTNIQIDPVTLNISLTDYAGGVLLKSQLSAGEKQMFAISLLWGLALTSGYKLPVVIDTPMARLDSAHRHNFVNRYLPNASSQVLVLSTDEEIYGKYLDQIKDHVTSYYTLRFDEEEQCTSIMPGYFEVN